MRDERINSNKKHLPLQAHILTHTFSYLHNLYHRLIQAELVSFSTQLYFDCAISYRFEIIWIMIPKDMHQPLSFFHALEIFLEKQTDNTLKGKEK